MTVLKVKAGAPAHNNKSWDTPKWRGAWILVRRLQMRIAKATREGKTGKVKSLQWILTHSYYAKALAVKRVSSNKGKRTPGVDKVLWNTSASRNKAVQSLRQHGYKAKPLRRIYIEKKKSGKYRPLSIPTMKDRAMQALYKLALTPVAESTADPNSYGFREQRSCADAIEVAFCNLSKPNSATWVLEADIAGCYDNISQRWMMRFIPMERRILGEWLGAGSVEQGKTYPTLKGTPQGGIISPTLANMTLDGLEYAIQCAVPRRKRVNVVRYADDFIVTGKSKAILEQKIKPAVEEFLSERGLELSKEKTRITSIYDGFTFLGQTFKKHKGKLNITPAKSGTLDVVRKIGKIIRKWVSSSLEGLIKELNSVLRGWGNYHRFVVTGKAFTFVDNYVYEQLWRMLRKRHQNKGDKWLAEHYWLQGPNRWTFSVKSKSNGKRYSVIKTRELATHRYRKIKSDANPFLKEYIKYFMIRKHVKGAKLRTRLSAREFRNHLKNSEPGYLNEVALTNARAV